MENNGHFFFTSKDFLNLIKTKSGISLKDCAPYYQQFEVAYYFLKKYSFRISEIFRLNLNGLVSNNMLYVKLSKCSDYFIIYDQNDINLFKDSVMSNNSDSFTFSYSEFYRFMLKNHRDNIIVNSIGNKKVTHSFRYLNSRNLKKIKNDTKLIQALLHHKSNKSQKYYLKEK